MNINIFPITTLPNTFEQNPRVTVMPLLGKRIVKGSVTFRDGCLNVVGVRIKSHGALIVPFNAGWLIGNNKYTEFYPNFILEGEGEGEIEVETFNYAVDYPHTVIVRLEVD